MRIRTEICEELKTRENYEFSFLEKSLEFVRNLCYNYTVKLKLKENENEEDHLQG